MSHNGNLQNIAKKAGAEFHTELHKRRKTGASRRYLADVRKPGEAKKAVADADFVPKPKIVMTGTDGD